MKSLFFLCIVVSVMSCSAQQELRSSLLSCLAGSPPYLARKCHAQAGKNLKKVLKQSGKLTDKSFSGKYKEALFSRWSALTFEKIEGELAACYRVHRYDRKEKFNCFVAAGRDLERFFKKNTLNQEVIYEVSE